ncbi:MAG: hypothetical protein ACK5IM_06170 [Demequina sp.]|uniref:hypothetical protein n=1 Tax=Demequina sp. TaxID=2050685 RepID=UPI003A844209
MKRLVQWWEHPPRHVDVVVFVLGVIASIAGRGGWLTWVGVALFVLATRISLRRPPLFPRRPKDTTLDHPK